MMSGSWMALVAAALLAAAPAASAQVRGVVVDAAGRPVPGAGVELWAGSRRVAAAASDSAGAFHLADAPAQSPFALSVRRLGLRTRVLDLAPADTVLVVRMEAEAIVLAPVVAQAERRICPNREDARARVLWERMRSRYWQQGMDSVAVFGLAELQSGTVAEEDVGSTDRVPAQAGWTEAVPSVTLMDARAGYAWRTRGAPGERAEHWFYMHLDGGAWQTFTQADFGARHTFSLVSAAPERTVIGFCARERLGERGQIEGTLTLRADTTLARARWAFRTRDPVEDARGEAFYQPPAAGSHALLLADEALFWKRARGGRYYFERGQFSGWRSLDGSVRPADAFRERSTLSPADP